MRKTISILALAFLSTAATAQTSTTNCNSYGSSISCTTQSQPGIDWNAWSQQQQAIQRQNQQNINQSFSNLGAAIAAERERRREKKAAEATAAANAEIEAEIKAAIASDNALAEPPPSDEQPVLLACTINGRPGSIALYEKHGRADTTSNGITRTRSATFTIDTVTWTSPLMRSSLSRLDGSFTGYPNIPGLEGQTFQGTCAVASERKF
jgi:hypothetical protein